jgi:hypothetical protein
MLIAAAASMNDLNESEPMPELRPMDDEFTQASTGWVHSNVHSTNQNIGADSSIALDSDKNPHISYYDDSTGDLRYAYFDGTTWSHESVETTNDVGSFSALAIDDNGRPHIAYYDATNSDLRYAHYGGTRWSRDAVDTTNDVGSHASIAMETSCTHHTMASLGRLKP